MTIIRIIIFILPFCIFSQNIYQGDIKNKFLDFKGTNELKNDRTFVQLLLNDDNTFILEGYTYGKKRCKKVIINCSKQIGVWNMKGQMLTLDSESSVEFNEEMKYSISIDGAKLHNLGIDKRNSRKMRLKKVVERKNFSCPKIEDNPKNDLK